MYEPRIVLVCSFVSQAPSPSGGSGREWCYVEPQVRMVTAKLQRNSLQLGAGIRVLARGGWSRSMGLLWCLVLPELVFDFLRPLAGHCRSARMAGLVLIVTSLPLASNEILFASRGLRWYEGCSSGDRNKTDDHGKDAGCEARQSTASGRGDIGPVRRMLHREHVWHC